MQLRFRQLQSFAGLVPMVQKLNGELLADLNGISRVDSDGYDWTINSTTTPQ